MGTFIAGAILGAATASYVGLKAAQFLSKNKIGIGTSILSSVLTNSEEDKSSDDSDD